MNQSARSSAPRTPRHPADLDWSDIETLLTDAMTKCCTDPELAKAAILDAIHLLDERRQRIRSKMLRIIRAEHKIEASYIAFDALTGENVADD